MIIYFDMGYLREKLLLAWASRFYLTSGAQMRLTILIELGHFRAPLSTKRVDLGRPIVSRCFLVPPDTSDRSLAHDAPVVEIFTIRYIV